jgi:DNA-binding transcriptional MerR regulator
MALQIGELAKETGVKVVTIRYYEQVGLLSPPRRTAGNYRTYNREDARRLHFIRRCRDLGFSVGQIRDLLRLSAENASSCADVCRLAKEHHKAIQDKLADLSRLASELARIAASCNGRRGMAQCRIIETLSRVATN